MQHTIRMIAALFFALVCSSNASAQNQPETKATLVLHNAKIVTVDDAIGTVDAIAVVDGRILDTGSFRALAQYIDQSTKVIDLDGKLVIPGFIEGHGHFAGLGESKLILDLTGATSWNIIVEMVARAAEKAAPGTWIVGRGWHQEKWNAAPDDHVEGFPTHWSLSEASPENPVFLIHASGHASFANLAAMNASGISATTADPEGGDILRDDQGNPTGLFRERASGLIKVDDGLDSRASRVNRMNSALNLAAEECIRHGITSFQDAGSSFATISQIQAKANEGTLGVRLWMMVRESNSQLQQHLHEVVDVKRIGNGFLTVGGIKRSIDGALGPRGAWLLEPYADSPDSTGLATATVEDVETSARLAREHNLQMCVHAIGDRANREVLDLYARVLADDPDATQRRWRIEHAQHLHPDDINRFASQGVLAAMQGVHCTSDGPWVFARLGDERAASGAYMWRDLLDSGAIIINGTDAPVERVDPIASFHASVTRQMRDGTPFFPQQCMTRMEALRSYTLHAAYGAFEEDVKGSLTAGKYADMIVLSRDIMTIPDHEIPGTDVLMTIVDGKIVYDARH